VIGLLKDIVVKAITIGLETTHAVVDKLRSTKQLSKPSLARTKYREGREKRRKIRNLKLRRLKERRKQLRDSWVGKEISGEEVKLSLSSSWSDGKEVKFDEDMNLFH